MFCCCGRETSARKPLTEEERLELRQKQLEAAEERQKNFQQGGGGRIQ
jgi:hypothetical protein